jgi:hypothetical protein
MVRKHAERFELAEFRSFTSASSSLSVIFLFPALILVGVLGCAPLVVPIDASAPIELAPSEALLIIHIDTEIALERLWLNSRPFAQSLGKGRFAWMVRVRSGSYRWQRIELGSQTRNRLKYQLGSDEELSFEVQAGKINYPGELVIRSGPEALWGNQTLIVRNRNHSAMMVREMRDSYDSILRSLPLHYAGPSGDGFLEYYTRNRERSAAESNGAENRKRRVEAQAAAP